MVTYRLHTVIRDLNTVIMDIITMTTGLGTGEITLLQRDTGEPRGREAGRGQSLTHRETGKGSLTIYRQIQVRETGNSQTIGSQGRSISVMLKCFEKIKNQLLWCKYTRCLILNESGRLVQVKMAFRSVVISFKCLLDFMSLQKNLDYSTLNDWDFFVQI